MYIYKHMHYVLCIGIAGHENPLGTKCSNLIEVRSWKHEVMSSCIPFWWIATWDVVCVLIVVSDRLQISLLILSELKRINSLLFALKSWENHRYHIFFVFLFLLLFFLFLMCMHTSSGSTISDFERFPLRRDWNIFCKMLML